MPWCCSLLGSNGRMTFPPAPLPAEGKAPPSEGCGPDGGPFPLPAEATLLGPPIGKPHAKAPIRGKDFPFYASQATENNGFHKSEDKASPVFPRFPSPARAPRRPPIRSPGNKSLGFVHLRTRKPCQKAERQGSRPGLARGSPAPPSFLFPAPLAPGPFLPWSPRPPYQDNSVQAPGPGYGSAQSWQSGFHSR